jgi:ribose transport system substrate-binding protein
VSRRRTSLLIALAACLLVLSSACAGGSSSSSSGKADGKYRVALSMSYSGNDWQGEAANLIKVAAKKEPLKSKVDELKVFVAGTEAQNQISQIQQMISSKYDAIIIYPISPTALNSVIKQGCDSGIVMMTYDASVTEPCAHNVTFDQKDAGKVTAEALSDLMGNKGNVVLITGVAGTSVDADRTSAAKAVFKERGIKVLDQCAGDWAQGPAGECMNRFLAAFDDIDGVWAQVGGPAVLDALDAAGKPYIPILSESENRFRQALLNPAYTKKGLKGASYGSPPWQGAAALQMAIDSLDNGTKLESTIDVGYPFLKQDQIKPCKDGTLKDMKSGCNTFTSKDVSAGFMADWYHEKWTGNITLDEVRTGKVAS